MNRRNFFRSMIGGVAAAAAVRTFPFRVFSFPSEVKTFWWKPEDIIGRVAPTFTTNASQNFLWNIQALELENIAEEIPDLIRSESTLWHLIRHRDPLEMLK